MAKKPEPPQKPTTWNVYKIASKAVWLGTVEAPDRDGEGSGGMPNSSGMSRTKTAVLTQKF
jgi:hypothetical protein